MKLGKQKQIMKNFFNATPKKKKNRIPLIDLTNVIDVHYKNNLTNTIGAYDQIYLTNAIDANDKPDEGQTKMT